MRKVAILVFGAALVAACSGEATPTASRAFCTAADKYNNLIDHQHAQGKIDRARELERVEDLARTAPKAIKKDADAFVDALRKVATDPSVKDDPDVKVAVDNVNRFANKACGVYSGGEGF